MERISIYATKASDKVYHQFTEPKLSPSPFQFTFGSSVAFLCRARLNIPQRLRCLTAGQRCLSDPGYGATDNWYARQFEPQKHLQPQKPPILDWPFVDPVFLEIATFGVIVECGPPRCVCSSGNWSDFSNGTIHIGEAWPHGSNMEEDSLWWNLKWRDLYFGHV